VNIQPDWGLFIPGRVVDRYFAQSATFAQQHEGLVDGNPRKPSGKGGFTFESMQMNESLLKGLLHDILGVFSHTSHAPRNEENSLLVTLDQNFKRLEIPTFRGSDEGQVTFVGKAVDTSNRRSFLVGAVYEFGWHSSAPSHKSSIRRIDPHRNRRCAAACN
jgi:hypothetical protein